MLLLCNFFSLASHPEINTIGGGNTNHLADVANRGSWGGGGGTYAGQTSFFKSGRKLHDPYPIETLPNKIVVELENNNVCTSVENYIQSNQNKCSIFKNHDETCCVSVATQINLMEKDYGMQMCSKNNIATQNIFCVNYGCEHFKTNYFTPPSAIILTTNWLNYNQFYPVYSEIYCFDKSQNSGLEFCSILNSTCFVPPPTKNIMCGPNKNSKMIYLTYNQDYYDNNSHEKDLTNRSILSSENYTSCSFEDYTLPEITACDHSYEKHNICKMNTVNAGLCFSNFAFFLQDSTPFSAFGNFPTICCKNNFEIDPNIGIVNGCSNNVSHNICAMVGNTTYEFRLWDTNSHLLVDYAFYNENSPANANYNLRCIPRTTYSQDLTATPPSVSTTQPQTSSDSTFPQGGGESGTTTQPQTSSDSTFPQGGGGNGYGGYGRKRMRRTNEEFIDDNGKTICGLIYDNFLTTSVVPPYHMCDDKKCFSYNNTDYSLTNCTLNPGTIVQNYTCVPPVQCLENTNYHYMLHRSSIESPYDAHPCANDFLTGDINSDTTAYCALNGIHTPVQFNSSVYDDVCDLAAGHHNCCSETAPISTTNFSVTAWGCTAGRCDAENFKCCFNDYPHGNSESQCVSKTKSTAEERKIYAYNTQLQFAYHPPASFYNYVLIALWNLDKLPGENNAEWARFVNYDPENPNINITLFSVAEELMGAFGLHQFYEFIPHETSVCDLAFSSAYNHCFSWWKKEFMIGCTTPSYFSHLNETHHNRIFNFTVCTETTSPRSMESDSEFFLEYKQKYQKTNSFFYVNQNYPNNFADISIRGKNIVGTYFSDEANMQKLAFREANLCYMINHPDVHENGKIVECSGFANFTGTYRCVHNDYKLNHYCKSQGDFPTGKNLICDNLSPGTFYKTIVGLDHQRYAGVRSDFGIRIECCRKNDNVCLNNNTQQSLIASNTPVQLICSAAHPNLPCCSKNNFYCEPFIDASTNTCREGFQYCETSPLTTLAPTPPPIRSSRPSEDEVIGIAVGAGVGGVLLISFTAYLITRNRSG